MKKKIAILFLLLAIISLALSYMELSLLFFLISFVLFFIIVSEKYDKKLYVEKINKNTSFEESYDLLQNDFKAQLNYNNKIKNDYEKGRKRTLEKITIIADKHKTALGNERQKLIMKDPYGNEIKTKWIKEGIEYFYTNVILKELKPDEIAYLDDYKPTNNFNTVFAQTNKKEKKESKIIRKEVIEIIENAALKRIIDSLKLTNYSDDLSGQEYEKLCGNILLKYGWEIELTKGSGDQGADIIALKNNIKIVIQCKNHAKAVGNKAVQEILGGLKFYNANKAIVVSSNGFTTSAKSLANVSNVILISHNELNILDDKLIIL